MDSILEHNPKPESVAILSCFPSKISVDLHVPNHRVKMLFPICDPEFDPGNVYGQWMYQ